jgi:heme-degrading monooxygenase HmoA
MIVRAWRARATAAGARAYVLHLRRRVVPALRRLRGYQGVVVLRRRRGRRLEVVVLTFWRSPAAIRAFAGADPTRAVVEPAARAVLASYDRRVTHFELVADLRRGGPAWRGTTVTSTRMSSR